MAYKLSAKAKAAKKKRDLKAAMTPGEERKRRRIKERGEQLLKSMVYPG